MCGSCSGSDVTGQDKARPSAAMNDACSDEFLCHVSHALSVSLSHFVSGKDPQATRTNTQTVPFRSHMNPIRGLPDDCRAPCSFGPKPGKTSRKIGLMLKLRIAHSRVCTSCSLASRYCCTTGCSRTDGMLLRPRQRS